METKHMSNTAINDVNHLSSLCADLTTAIDDALSRAVPEGTWVSPHAKSVIHMGVQSVIDAIIQSEADYE